MRSLSYALFKTLCALASYVARVQTAGDGGVGGAFDDGAAVGEESYLVGVVPEFQDEIVVTHYAVRLKATVHGGEVDRALALMNLHGISATQRDMRAGFASEMDEIALATRAATGARFDRGDFGVLVGPDVEGKESPPELGNVRSADYEFQRFGCGN